MNILMLRINMMGESDRCSLIRYNWWMYTPGLSTLNTCVADGSSLKVGTLEPLNNSRPHLPYREVLMKEYIAQLKHIITQHKNPEDPFLNELQELIDQIDNIALLLYELSLVCDTTTIPSCSVTNTLKIQNDCKRFVKVLKLPKKFTKSLYVSVIQCIKTGNLEYCKPTFAKIFMILTERFLKQSYRKGVGQ